MLLTENDYENIKKEINAEIDEAADRASHAPDPEPEDAVKHIFDESGFKG